MTIEDIVAQAVKLHVPCQCDELSADMKHHGCGFDRVVRHAATAAREVALEEAAVVADAQRTYWTEARAQNGNYKVISAMSECSRVAKAIRALKEAP